MLNIGIFGHGIVGGGVANILLSNKDILSLRAGQEINLKAICDIKEFDVPYKHLFTKNGEDIYADPEISIVVEAIGGKGIAYKFVKESLLHGKHVVTSNKELIAACGTELEQIAKENHVLLRYEASCGGGIPVIKPIREDLGANRMDKILGIVNGTTNYILTRMKESALSFEEAIEEARGKGYIEADPTADLKGWDARRKICILAHTAFGTALDDSAIEAIGIEHITMEDLAYAAKLNRSLRLIAMAEWLGGAFRASVCPMLVGNSHPLAPVSDVFNAILVHGDQVNDVMFYGSGAGAAPTASAVCGDVLDIAKDPVEHGRFVDASDSPALPSFTRDLALFFRVSGGENEQKFVLFAFPGAQIVTAETVPGEFGVVTEIGRENELLSAVEKLKESLSVREPLRLLD